MESPPAPAAPHAFGGARLAALLAGPALGLLVRWLEPGGLTGPAASVLGVGIWFLKRNEDAEDYYLGGRSMGAGHIGLSVVATDVGGGFSIGLGGLGFTMGLSGSWLLFTGLIGAWMAAVLLIPRVHRMGLEHRLSTYPQIFAKLYSPRVALMAALVSAIRQAPIEPGMPVPDVLVIVPPPIENPRGPVAAKFQGAEAKCVGLAAAYGEVADELRCHFFDAGSVTPSSRIDGVHLDADQHRVLGEALVAVVEGLVGCADGEG